jgi:hypothetical protein
VKAAESTDSTTAVGRGQESGGAPEDKPTPGPWRVKDAIYEVHKKQHGWVVGTVEPMEPYGDEISIVYSLAGGTAEANAKLIASAPELKAALKDVLCELRPLYEAWKRGTLSKWHPMNGIMFDTLIARADKALQESK